MVRFVLGTLAGGLAVWYWRDQLQELAERKTEGLRKGAARHAQNGRGDRGRRADRTKEQVSSALQAGQDAIRPPRDDAERADEEATMRDAASKHLRGVSSKEQRQYEHIKGVGQAVGPIRPARQGSGRADRPQAAQVEGTREGAKGPLGEPAAPGEAPPVRRLTCSSPAVPRRSPKKKLPGKDCFSSRPQRCRARLGGLRPRFSRLFPSRRPLPAGTRIARL